MLPHSHPPRGDLAAGGVLLLVLLVLAIAASALAAVGRMSLRKALVARRAEEELQRRWAVAGCRAVLLPRAEAVLAQAEKEGGGPVAEVRREVQVGGHDMTLVFADEQAKANVNLLYRAGGPAGAERAVRRLIGTADLPVNVRPLPEPAGQSAEDEPAPLFVSFGQVFDTSPPARLVDLSGSARTSPASAVTCWGDGSLNFRRAPTEAVREVCARHAGGALANRLVQVRDKHPEMDAAQALDQVRLSERAREALEELLVDDSGCHSLWIVTRWRDRSRYDLAVMDESSDAGGRPLVFSW